MAAVSPVAVAPMADEGWHPVARRWFDSLASSPVSCFYSDSDWSLAYLIAESMSREFKPQPIKVGDQIVMVERPPTAASIQAWLKASTALVATEGDRRRNAVELQPRSSARDDGGYDPVWFADAQRRLRGPA